MPDQKKFFVHPKAIVESMHIGEDTRIWAFCNVQEKARIGAGCNICDHCFVENNVIIGNNVTVKMADRELVITAPIAVAADNGAIWRFNAGAFEWFWYKKN